METLANPYSALLLLGSVMALPFIVVASTSFVKIATVLLILRSALGIQQAPPNMALYAVALALSVFIMAPVGDAMLKEAARLEQLGAFNSIQTFLELGGSLFAPIGEFLAKHSRPEMTQLFTNRATILWPEEFRVSIGPNNILIQVPAFLLSELSLAFQIAILVYLPFVVIDLVVANVLTALGMMMVSPTLVSIPFKLLLFVLIDGWYRLLDGLVLSYV